MIENKNNVAKHEAFIIALKNYTEKSVLKDVSLKLVPELLKNLSSVKNILKTHKFEDDFFFLNSFSSCKILT